MRSTLAPSADRAASAAGERTHAAAGTRGDAGGRAGGPGSLLSLGSAIGNRRLGAALRIGAADDPAERAADGAAARATGVPPAARGSGPDGLAGAPAPPVVHAVLRGGGEPLAADVRAFMERGLGRDFGGVRVHTGPQAASSARAVGARAYAVGPRLVFGDGEYAPGTLAGRLLLAHELAHVAQGGAAVLRRQPVPGVAAPAAPAAPGAAGTAGPDFGDVAGDAACPPTSYLARQAPEPDCPVSDEEITGEHFHFCRGSDVFTPPEERTRLIRFARGQAADATFTVHGFASEEGDVVENVNLSCHRARRAARELANAGVRPERIRVAHKGISRRFPARPDHPRPRSRQARLEANRVVVVRAEAAGARPPAATPPTGRSAVVAEARERIVRGEYRLAADAYLSLWSCGRIPGFAEALRRTTVRVEGEGPYGIGGDSRLGVVSGAGRNEIVLSSQTFDQTTDPVACAMARIMDMSFHHMVQGIIPDAEVHAAALFAVELAGLAPCVTPAQTVPGSPGLVLTPATRWWARPTQDPRAGLRPPCADAPLPGAVQPQPGPRTPARVPTFTTGRFVLEGGQGAAQSRVAQEPGVLPARYIVTAQVPGGGFRGAAQVTAAGDPAEVPNYVAGFIQTVVQDQQQVEYVAGDQVELAVPVPMRDGPPRGPAGPPWLQPDRVARFATPGAAVGTGMAHGPSMSLPYLYVDVDRLGRRGGPGALQPGNVLNRARQRTVFHTWLVVRRQDAPLDRFSTRFLDGRTVTWTLEVDVTGTEASATYQAEVSAGPPADTAPMQLGGPTPAELDTASPYGAFRSLRTVRTAGPVPRAQAGGSTLAAFHDRVRAVAAELEPLRRVLGLRGRLTVWVRIDPESGRVAVGTREQLAVWVETAEGPDPGAASHAPYASELLVRLRKDLVLAPLSGREAALRRVPTTLNPLPGGGPPAQPNPFAPEHGVGLVQHIREAAEREDSARQLESRPGVFDPDFVPEVTVVPERENYLYDFRVPFLGIDTVCQDHTMHTLGCVKVTDSSDRAPTVNVRSAPQTLDGTVFVSPLAVEIVTFPIGFTMYVPRERLQDGDTFNHEVHHIVENYTLLQSFKDRLARRVRARVRQARREAAAHPALRGTLLGQETLEAIVRQEIAPFNDWFLRAYAARHAPVDAADVLPPLRESDIRAFWPAFRMPPRTPDARGSFTP